MTPPSPDVGVTPASDVGMPPPSPRTAAIVPAGGRSSRMGADKTGLPVGGRSLLDRVLTAALVVVEHVVVVGEIAPSRLPARVTVLVEDPPGAGPLHALSAGLKAVDAVSAAATGGSSGAGLNAADLRDTPSAERRDPRDDGPGIDAGFVYVLAADLPFLTPDVLQAVRPAPGQSAALAVDDEGRDQFLLACWRPGALRAAIGALGATDGQSLRRLYAGVDYARVHIAGHPPPWWDCDTPQALAAARSWSGEAEGHDSR